MNPVRNKLTGSGWSFKNIKVFIRIISNRMKISLQIHRQKILFAGSLLLLLLVLLIPAGITHAEGLLGWVFGAADVAAGWTIGALLTPVVAIVTSLMAILTTFAGTLFDFAISYTIIEYSKELGGPIQEGINVVWVMFRDIANIVLIGVFVYIAFNVMLNVSNFDAPKFAARVLVIAVLINFSLFFTKVIIDVSNITAIQFYETLIADSNNKEIAEAFMGKVGISSTWANQSFLTDTISATSQGITKLLAYAIFTSLFLAAVASIFLYAVILLFSRALTFIFLMVTSPLAFAAFMVPQMEKHWKTWWSLLLKNALFAPLLMMMLWATLTITENLNGDGKSLVDAINGNLGALGGLINIVIILGLFYASVRISSDLSLMGTDIADKISKKSFGFMAKWGGAGMATQGALWGYNLTNRGVRNLGRRIPGFNNSQWGQRFDAALDNMQSHKFGKTELGKKLEKETGLSSTQPVGAYAMNKYKTKVDKDSKERIATAERKDILLAQKKLLNKQKVSEKDGTKEDSSEQPDKVSPQGGNKRLDDMKQDLENQLKDSEDAVRGQEMNISMTKSAISNTSDEGTKNKLGEQVSEQEAEMGREKVKIEEVKKAIDKLQSGQISATSLNGSGSNAAEQELQKISDLLKADNLQNRKYQQTTLRRERNRKDLDSEDGKSAEAKKAQKRQKEYKEFKPRLWDRKATKDAKARAAEIYSRKQKSKKSSSESSSDVSREELINKINEAGLMSKGDAANAIN